MATADITNEASKIKIRRDSAENWIANNPILDEGEIGIEWVDETQKKCYIKVGNGHDHYLDLEYLGGSLSQGVPTPEFDYNDANESTLPTINSVMVKGDLTLEQLGVQPLGSYVSTSTFVTTLATKADKNNVYDKDEVEGLIDSLLKLPDVTGHEGEYLKVRNSEPVWSPITEDVVTTERLEEELATKVDVSTLEELDVPGLKATVQALSNTVDNKVDTDDFVLLQQEVDTKADVENVYDKAYIDATVAGFATVEDLQTLQTTKADKSALIEHTLNTSNPHNVTLTQLGLSEDYNGTSPLSLPISVATQTALNDKQDAFDIGYGLELTNEGVLRNTLPNVQSDWLAEQGTDGAILNKPNLATVATTGSYNDLTDKPEIIHYVLPVAEQEVLGGIKLGEDFTVDEDGHLKAVNSGISYNDLTDKPSIVDIDGTVYTLTDHMTAADLNLASLTVARAIDEHLQQQIDDINSRAELPPIDGHDGEYLKVDGNTVVWSTVGGGYVTHEELEEALETKADTADTLAGYGITNAYTKTEINDKLTLKADKTTVTQQLAGKEDVANKTQTLDGLTEDQKTLYYPSAKAVLDALGNAGSVKSVNGNTPDASGDVTVYAAVIKDWTLD